jgi:hypothetical protein
VGDVSAPATPVNVAALAYGIIAIVNMCWPRTPDAPWYDNWLVALSGAIVIGLGLAYMALHRSYGRSEAPYDDAIPSLDPVTVVQAEPTA